MVNSKKIAVVGGCGHVGLPLALAFASVGNSVISFDISEDAVSRINSGIVPFVEEGALSVLQVALQSGLFTATTDPEKLSEVDIVFIVIGTPVDEYLSPDPNLVVTTILNLRQYLRNDQLLILRSTIFPGVTKRLEEIISIEIPGIEVVYCPERIIEGKALSEIKTLPQIIGASGDSQYNRAKEIFDLLSVDNIRTSPEEAELAKLFTNVWRYIKFAAANQFWMMSNDLGVDFENVRAAITFDYPRAADLPKPGFAAGPCLFKDTMQLSALVQQNFPLGSAAMMINEGTPGYLVNRLEQIYDLKSCTIGILGMAFKAEVDDIRGSLSFKLRKLLQFKSKQVLITDPYVSDDRLFPLEYVLEHADILIIGAPHLVYSEIKTHKPVIDIWANFGRTVKI